MLEISSIIEHKEKCLRGLQNRGIKNSEELINNILDLDSKRKILKTTFDRLSAEIKTRTSEIEQRIKNTFDRLSAEIKTKTSEIEQRIKTKESIEEIKNEVYILKNDLKLTKDKLTSTEELLKNALYNIPNCPSEKSPIGENSKENKVVFQTSIPEVKIKIPHYEIIKKLDIIDFELGNKLTGAGFPVYKGFGARLQRALINFFLDEAVKAGFKEHELPILCNDDSFYGTGQMPDKEQQMYKVDNAFHLIPTAEVPLTNIYRDVIIEEKDLPIKITGYTPCFRREAGSWGKDVRGLNRLHQFDKIEIVEIVKPEDSYEVLEKMRDYVEGLVKKLNLPYRVLALCTGDLGFNAAFTYDIEVYSIGQDMWLEASSISNFESYQANRLMLRYKNTQGEKRLCHTLNGSALALPRIVAALIELNYDGEKIKVPQVLEKYF